MAKQSLEALRIPIDDRVIVKQLLYRCPKCGHEQRKYVGFGSVIESFFGDCCMPCYQKWIAENVPAMELVEQKGNEKNVD